MEETFSSKTSVDFQRNTQRYIPGEKNKPFVTTGMRTSNPTNETEVAMKQ
jgi:hypothetical protein